MSELETQAMEISVLPMEILVEIFKYLPLYDRKNVKLVSHHWNCIINSSSRYFLKTDKIVCRGIHSTEEIITRLIDLKQTRVNLEFQNVSFIMDWNPFRPHWMNSRIQQLDFWKDYGCRINELHFLNSEFDDEVFERMVEFCSSVKHLRWSSVQNSQFCSTDVLNRLIERNIVRPSVAYLELSIADIQLLPKLATVFPRIKRYMLHFNFIINEETYARQLEQLKRTESAFSRFLNFSAPILEGIGLNFGKSRSDIIREILTACINSTITLKEVEIRVYETLQRELQSTILNFVTKHPQLEVVRCWILAKNYAGKLGSDLLKYFFKFCPRLRRLHLQLNAISNVHITKETLMNLESSKLETLFIQCGHTWIESESYPLEGASLNRSLWFLCIYSQMRAADQLLLISLFRNLKHLELNWFHDDVLLSIWNHQTQLTSLRFITGILRSKCGFREVLSPSADATYNSEPQIVTEYNQLSIARLQKLEYLLMKLHGSNNWEAEYSTFQGFILPNLRYLYVDIEGDSMLHIAFTKVLQKCTKLEALYIVCDERIQFDSWLDMCSVLRNLRFLNIHPSSRMNLRKTTSPVRDLFFRCPSLRVLVYHYRSFYYDRKRKEVLHIGDIGDYKFTSEKTDDFFIDWMKF